MTRRRYHGVQPLTRCSRWLFAPALVVGLSSSNAWAQHEEAAHQEHFHRNSVGFLIANTYEAEGKVNIFTIGGEYSHWFTERFGISGAFEYGPQPNAWVFVAPFAFKVAGELEVFAGPGIEHLSRRAHGHEEEAQGEVSGEGGGDNLFLFRVGVGYHIPLGERFYMLPSVALDFVNEESEVAKAVVYGVTFGLGF